MSLVAYDFATIEQFKANLYFPELMDLRPLPRRYKSNWRILHIDRFEDGKPIFWHPLEGFRK